MTLSRNSMERSRRHRRLHAIQKMRDTTHSFDVCRAFQGYRLARRLRTISAPKLTRVTKRSLARRMRSPLESTRQDRATHEKKQIGCLGDWWSGLLRHLVTESPSHLAADTPAQKRTLRRWGRYLRRARARDCSPLMNYYLPTGDFFQLPIWGAGRNSEFGRRNLEGGGTEPRTLT